MMNAKIYHQSRLRIMSKDKLVPHCFLPKGQRSPEASSTKRKANRVHVWWLYLCSQVSIIFLCAFLVFDSHKRDLIGRCLAYHESKAGSYVYFCTDFNSVVGKRRRMHYGAIDGRASPLSAFHPSLLDTRASTRNLFLLLPSQLTVSSSLHSHETNSKIDHYSSSNSKG